MKSILKEILSTSVYLLVVLLITYFIVNFVGQRTQVVGSSMESTLSNGDNLIVDKITYRFQDPERYDIIVFPYQYEKNTYYIKRIIGMPGERVRIDGEGIIYINGKELNEYYGKEIIVDPGIASQEIVLGMDEYFVMGDNRNNSTDSRDSMVGNIHKKDILGRAWLRIWPLYKFELLEHQ
ncbi:MAG: signal peptidase I [Lachnospiraceae bacterium]|nr:signal peptidase I [Lachnospiraceae bacterium]